MNQKRDMAQVQQNAEHLRLLMANSKDVVCPNCNGKYFRQVFEIRSVSKLLAGTAEDAMIPIPTFRCDDCGLPAEEFQIPKPNNSTSTPPPSPLITE